MEHETIAEDLSRSIAKRIALGIALLIAFLIFIVLGGIAVQLLWNWLVPDLFELRRITIWEALGLLALCRILFGRFGGRGFGPRFSRRHMAARWEAGSSARCGTRCCRRCSAGQPSPSGRPWGCWPCAASCSAGSGATVVVPGAATGMR